MIFIILPRFPLFFPGTKRHTDGWGGERKAFFVQYASPKIKSCKTKIQKSSLYDIQMCGLVYTNENQRKNAIFFREVK